MSVESSSTAKRPGPRRKKLSHESVYGMLETDSLISDSSSGTSTAISGKVQAKGTRRSRAKSKTRTSYGDGNVDAGTPAGKRTRTRGRSSLETGLEIEGIARAGSLAKTSGGKKNGDFEDVKYKRAADVESMGSQDSDDEASIAEDRWNIVLLVVLYLLQGIPLGLTFGSIPFLLKNTSSYSDLALFSLSQYPYSLKLFWSPIVDTYFSGKLGRRKSWIVPIQFITGFLMLFFGPLIQTLMNPDAETGLVPVSMLTFTFTSAVVLCATQDIAVDGWALTLLSEKNKAYASTAQTIGLNTGYFLSFTIFLAFNSVDFCNVYVRPLFGLSTESDLGILQLGPYIQFWGLMFLLCNIYLLFFKKEAVEDVDESETVGAVYKNIWRVCSMPHMRGLIAVLFLSKIGFQANEGVTSLKLIEKGLKKEDLALSVFIDFPFQFVFGYYAAKWSNNGKSPLTPWIFGFFGRLCCAGLGVLLVKGFPTDGVSSSYFATVIGVNLLTSFMSTMQFVSIGSFFTRISDPAIGGTYMTLLNTLSNLGGTWPGYFVLRSVEYFTEKTCNVDGITECGNVCIEAGGECSKVVTEGYYTTSYICMAIGWFLLITFILPRVRSLQSLPPAMWKLVKPASTTQDSRSLAKSSNTEGLTRKRSTRQRSKSVRRKA